MLNVNKLIPRIKTKNKKKSIQASRQFLDQINFSEFRLMWKEFQTFEILNINVICFEINQSIEKHVHLLLFGIILFGLVLFYFVNKNDWKYIYFFFAFNLNIYISGYNPPVGTVEFVYRFFFFSPFCSIIENENIQHG